MNIVLWILQALLAVHTAIGAVWKFSHSAEQTMPSLKAIPQGVWLALGGFELLVSLCLILPAVLYKPWAVLIPIAAVCIIIEMLLFTGLHIYSGPAEYGPVIYWLIIAALCGFVAYGRCVLRPF